MTLPLCLFRPAERDSTFVNLIYISLIESNQPFLIMIIFNTIKKADHYVSYCNKKVDGTRGDYMYSATRTFIKGEYVLRNHSGDSCGCGCDNYIYDYYEIIGRIKGYDTKSIREEKLKKIIG